MTKINYHSRKIISSLYEGRFSDEYDYLYSWKKRLSQELPFFQRLIKKYSPKTALDCGCGNGFHLALLAQLSSLREITGFDGSAHMLEKASSNLALLHEKSIVLTKGNFQDFSKKLTQTYDLITCMYSLTSLSSEKEVISVLKQLKGRLSIRGRLVIDDLNGDRIVLHKPPPETKQMEAPEYFLLQRNSLEVRISDTPYFAIQQMSQKIIVRMGNSHLYKWLRRRHVSMTIFTRMGRFVSGDYIFFFPGILRRPSITHHKLKLLILTKNILARCLKKAGFTRITFYGDYNESTYSTRSFNQLIVAQ